MAIKRTEYVVYLVPEYINVDSTWPVALYDSTWQKAHRYILETTRFNPVLYSTTANEILKPFKGVYKHARNKDYIKFPSEKYFILFLLKWS